MQEHSSLSRWIPVGSVKAHIYRWNPLFCQETCTDSTFLRLHAGLDAHRFYRACGAGGHLLPAKRAECGAPEGGLLGGFRDMISGGSPF